MFQIKDFKTSVCQSHLKKKNSIFIALPEDELGHYFGHLKQTSKK